jgi:hypothetical protein
MRKNVQINDTGEEYEREDRKRLSTKRIEELQAVP